ncbi:TPA: putative DNA-binding domain-containing protein [Escherichia coli]|uniref:DUF2063 domain-containing protein n=9 Tax=Enterobacteriaceae TaxID=543 RepID=A0A2N5AN48_KLEVA|nr:MULTISPECIES: DNA-binding domain-containing protein [Enterobacterales]EAA8228214.1 DUF2063 domain-containing protein [Salmonella enterica subsp. enterica]EBH9178935.1 DUF2063 domain-containing protein [Salmonella enterica subsp. enterica serovar 4,[5],12:i:-]ECB4019461.1 DUF2063 domain-containing protein [Salmonella enterica subsp. enterica serovar Haifa]ECE0747102.1 DUF2063 domain-containing protein [Salmonella enterica subsp. enterica serovar Meleagridis]ECM4721316.1 DUF2063 domain-contai
MQTITCDPSEPDYESAFGYPLLRPELEAPLGLRTWNGSDPAQRYGIYRNNVMVSLTEALADNFPTIRTQVGEAFFTAMSACYIRQHLPDSPVLAFYGSNMPAFIAAFEPLRDYPWLSDLARMDMAFIRASHAGDAAAPVYSSLPEELMMLKVVLHPSLQLMCSSWAIFSLWMRDRDGDQGMETEFVDPAQPQSVMLFRPHLDVMVQPIQLASARFVDALMAGKTLMKALEDGLDCDAAFEPTLILRGLIHRGLVLNFSHDVNGETL